MNNWETIKSEFDRILPQQQGVSSPVSAEIFTLKGAYSASAYVIWTTTLPQNVRELAVRALVDSFRTICEQAQKRSAA